MREINWTTACPETRHAALARPAAGARTDLSANVAGIFDDVKNRGDAALRELRHRFDNVDQMELAVELTAGESETTLKPGDKAAIADAMANIRRFHEAQTPWIVKVETQPGVTCSLRQVPFSRIGVYVPGGRAPLVSSLLMAVVPARVAGVPHIDVFSPPRGHGLVDPAIAYACRLLGIDRIYALGGPAAIAAMTCGTETISPVDKIFGPGNTLVDAAKRYAAGLPGGPAIDLPAGPSEVLVIADDSAEADFVAADLLAQAEHDSDAHCLLVTPSAQLTGRVRAELVRQRQSLPRQSEINGALANACSILVADLTEAVEVANAYAPEHLILNITGAIDILPDIRTAGAVFVGDWSPEAAGDYATGANHVLPTGGAARSYSGLTLSAFMRSMTVQELTGAGLRALGPTITALARLEGLEAHARSVDLRLEKLAAKGDAA